MAGVILVLAVIAVSLVHIRREELTCRHEIQRLQTRQVILRRELWDQQARLGYLTTPQRTYRRAAAAAMGASGEVLVRRDADGRENLPE